MKTTLIAGAVNCYPESTETTVELLELHGDGETALLGDVDAVMNRTTRFNILRQVKALAPRTSAPAREAVVAEIARRMEHVGVTVL